MLKITVEPEGDEVRMKLEGDLAGTWVGDLEECWRATRASSAGKPACLDLTGVTRVDDAGQVPPGADPRHRRPDGLDGRRDEGPPRLDRPGLAGDAPRRPGPGRDPVAPDAPPLSRRGPGHRSRTTRLISMEKPMKNRFRPLPVLSLLAAVRRSTVACGKPPAGPPQGPAEVGRRHGEPREGRPDDRAPRPDLALPRRRGPPAGERPHPRAGLRGGLRREGGRAPLPDRPGPLPGRVRPGEGGARDGRGEPPGRPLRAPSG